GSAYDDRVVRARLAQAFGRLIRRAGDQGVFVILSAAMPSRLLAAFPPGVPIRRVPLDQAITRVEEFLPGTGRGTAMRSSVVEGAHGGRSETVGPLHHPSDGPPLRPGED
ncbi:MAG: hypothetical protein ABI770_09930, partial [Sphingomicrobium sp.]